MTADSRLPMKRIACEEVILDDLSVYSRQQIVIPHANSATLSVAFVVESYLAFVRKCTLSIVRPVETGGDIAFTLFGASSPLLIFAGPEFGGDGRSQSASLRIEGGLLVQRNECGKGMLAFLLEFVEEGVRVTVQVSDYCPLLLGGHKPSVMRQWIYRWTQAFVHKMITVRFLAHLYRELESCKR